jgi:DNA-3-methyladenine glycosylase
LHRQGELLPVSFYARDAVLVSRSLLGKRLVRLLGGQRLAGMIVETEAYCGLVDQGSHAYRGPTPRTAVMFAQPGHAYVYFIYGMHFCFNVVAHLEGRSGAVLVRAVHPLEGLDTMRANRNNLPETQVSNGPAKLCEALGIRRAHNGVDLSQAGELWLEDAEPVPDEQVEVGPRVGLNVRELALKRPWRFALAGDAWVSRPRLNSRLIEAGLLHCPDLRED